MFSHKFYVKNWKSYHNSKYVYNNYRNKTTFLWIFCNPQFNQLNTINLSTFNKQIKVFYYVYPVVLKFSKNLRPKCYNTQFEGYVLKAVTLKMCNLKSNYFS